MIRNIRVGQHSIRTSVRAGDPARPPLVLANGIGPRLGLLQPFVDEMDPDIGVIRFDAPAVGGSPLPSGPDRFTGLVRPLDRVLDQLGCDQVDMLGISWGGGAGAAVRVAQATTMPPSRAGQHGDRITDGPRRAPDPEEHDHPPASSRPALRGAGRRQPLRGDGCAGIRNLPGSFFTITFGWAPDAGMCTSSWPDSAGRACRSCR
jgi:hypothetical protein